jgi:hypothetical protein
VLVLCQETVVPLTIIHARTIGLMTMIDAGKQDHKIIAVATEDPGVQLLSRGRGDAAASHAHAAPLLSGLQTARRQSRRSRRDTPAPRPIPSSSTRCTATANSAAKASRASAKSTDVKYTFP